MIRPIYWGLLLLLAMPAMALARPVSYPGGWTWMQQNDLNAYSVHAHYSPTARYSIGYKGEYWRQEDWQFHGVQLNTLVKRWNTPDSQANLYFKNAAGVAYSDFGTFNNRSQAANITSIAADWETRRYFTSYVASYYYAGDIAKFFMHKARVGVAPYIGDYGDIHTWLMLQVDHNPTRHKNFAITPLVRFFKDEYLVEAGMSQTGDVLFNWIIRF